MIPWNSEEWVGDCLIIKNNKNRMKDKIKENIEKEEIENKVISYINKNNQLDYSRVIKKTIKETSKAKDEEFKEILNGWYNSLNTSLDCLTKTIHDKDFEKLKREIKQRRQEK
jgi:nitrogenase subunit NifH